MSEALRLHVIDVGTLGLGGPATATLYEATQTQQGAAGPLTDLKEASTLDADYSQDLFSGFTPATG